MSDLIAAPPTSPNLDRDNMFSRLSQWVGGARPTNIPYRPQEVATTWSDETLDQIGADNEDIKNRCIDVVRKLDELSDVRTTFVEIVDRVGKILSTRETTNAALVERGMMIALAEGALQDLKAESRALYECKEELRSENSLLLSENERLKGSVRTREARIESVESELQKVTDTATLLRNDLDRERDQLAHTDGELQLAQLEIQKNDALISQVQAELAATRDAHAFAEQHVQSLQSNLMDSQQSAAKLQTLHAESQIFASGLSDKIREMEIALESERRQIGELDGLLASTQAEHQKAQTRWQQETEQNRLTIAELESRIDKLTAHSVAADRLLAEVRAELQAKTDQFRAEERRAQEIDAKYQRLVERHEAEALESDDLRGRLESRDRLHARLTGRAKGLIRAMRDLNTDLEKSEQKAALSAERLATETRRFDERTGQLEQTIHDLTEQLEKERLSKAMTEGALEAARQKRVQAREDVKLADILARAEEAHPMDDRDGTRR
jgi:chromosome segregation ATPase